MQRHFLLAAFGPAVLLGQRAGGLEAHLAGDALDLQLLADLARVEDFLQTILLQFFHPAGDALSAAVPDNERAVGNAGLGDAGGAVALLLETAGAAPAAGAAATAHAGLGRLVLGLVDDVLPLQATGAEVIQARVGRAGNRRAIE